MKNSFYMKEFQYFDGAEFITFNIVDVNLHKNVITVAITNRGRISVLEYDLIEDNIGVYFEYGVDCIHIHLDDFEEVD